MAQEDTVRIEWQGKVGRIPRARLQRYLDDGARELDPPPGEKKDVEQKGKKEEAPSTASRVWNALNEPIGQKELEEKGAPGGIPQRLQQLMSDLAGKNLPPSVAGPVAGVSNVLTSLLSAPAEAGRRSTTPLSYFTAGVGGLLQRLREFEGVPKAVKAITGATETAGGAGFSASSAKQVLTPRQKGESGLDELERRLSALGQTIAGGVPFAHAIEPTSRSVGQIIPRSRAQVEEFVHAGGLATREHLQMAVNNARKQISTLATDVSNKVDGAHPEGAIDATAVVKGIKDDLQQVVKLPEPKLPTALTKITDTPAGARSTGPRIMGEHIDLSNPQHLKMFEKIKPSLTPEEITRMEGQLPKERWGFEEAKQLRTELGASLKNLHGPVRAAAKLAYGRLSDAMRAAATEQNMVRQWEYYNRLNKALEERLDGKLGTILTAETGREVAQKLSSDPAFARELFADLKKYGLDVEAVSRFTKYSEKAETALQKGIVRHWPAAIFGGYFGRMFGVPWAESAMAAGYGAPLVRLMRAAKTGRESPMLSQGEEVIRKRRLPEPEEAAP